MAQRSATMKSMQGPAEGDQNDTPEWATNSDGSGGTVATTPVLQSGEIVRSTPAFDALTTWCQGMYEAQDEEGGGAMEEIVQQILSGGNAEEILREQLPVSGKDFIGVPMTVLGFRINEADEFEGEGCPYFASMRVLVGDPPEPKVINCGGWAVMAAIAALDNTDGWPQRVKLAGKKNKKGRTPLRLVAAD